MSSFDQEKLKLIDNSISVIIKSHTRISAARTNKVNKAESCTTEGIAR
jgi:hypothetical protein